MMPDPRQFGQWISYVCGNLATATVRALRSGSRCHFCAIAVPIAFAAMTLVGCNGSVLRSRSQSPEPMEGDDLESLTKYVGDFTVAYGTSYQRVEAPVLITGLAGTGSDPQPGPQRAALLADMEAHNVVEPSKILAEPSNSLAWAVAYLPPGVHKGDRIDVEVRVPGQSDTTSLRGGWMMETRLKEMAVIAGQIHDGNVLATAEGPVLVNPAPHDSADPIVNLRGVVLGGGVAQKSRSLGLVLRDADKSVFVSKQIGDAINRRFHTYIKGTKQGVATPKTDAFVALEVHPRYSHNLGRYLQVVKSVAVSESPQQQLDRLELLQRQLLDPVTSATAAIRLEAIGKDGIRVLKMGLDSTDPEVRFHAAESLAYLDDPSSVPTLAGAAKTEPALRAAALSALSALNDVQAADALHELLDLPSAETRYGAFRALWAKDEHDPQLRGEHLANKFWMYEIPSAAEPMVHVTHSFRPEITLFGEGQKFTLPLALEAGNSIIVKSQADGEISIARFSAHEKDQRRIVKNSVADVIRAISAVGGDYPDAVQALQEARASGALASRFEVDALPDWGRMYERNHKLAQSAGATAENSLAVVSSDKGKHGSKSSHAASSSAPDADDSGANEMGGGDSLPSLFGSGAPKPNANNADPNEHLETSKSTGKSAEKTTGEISKTSSQAAGFGVE